MTQILRQSPRSKTSAKTSATAQHGFFNGLLDPRRLPLHAPQGTTFTTANRIHRDNVAAKAIQETDHKSSLRPEENGHTGRNLTKNLLSASRPISSEGKHSWRSDFTLRNFKFRVRKCVGRPCFCGGADQRETVRRAVAAVSRRVRRCFGCFARLAGLVRDQ